MDDKINTTEFILDLDINSGHAGISWCSVCLKNWEVNLQNANTTSHREGKAPFYAQSSIHPQTFFPPPCYPFSELKFNGILKQIFLHITH